MFPWSDWGFPSTNFTQHSFHKRYDPDGSFRQYRLNTSLTVFSECARRPQTDYIWIISHRLMDSLYWVYCIIGIDSSVMTHSLLFLYISCCGGKKHAFDTLFGSFNKIKNKRNLNIWIFGIKEANISVILQFKWFTFNAPYYWTPKANRTYFFIFSQWEEATAKELRLSV